MPFVYFTWRSFLSSIFPLSPFPPVFIRYLLSLSVCLSVYLFIFLSIYLSRLALLYQCTSVFAYVFTSFLFANYLIRRHRSGPTLL